jgi:tetratricopeptide (TPR) repeat protein
VTEDRRLDSWKEIAAYLNRSERTVRRWEANEGLPVHRLQHDKRGTVYAYPRELERWRDSRRLFLEAETAGGRSWRRPLWRWLTLGLASAAALTLGVWWTTSAMRSSPRAPNPEAYRAFMKAHFGENAGRAQVLSGIHYYQEAIRLDPGFADAWSGLATAHVALAWFGEVPPVETITDARREAQQALRLDASLAAPWRVLAMANHFIDWNHSAAEQQFRTAIARDPRDAVALSWFAEFLIDLGRFDEAAEFARRAQDASPRWLEPITVAGNVYYFTRHAELAIAEYQRALDIEPGYGLANHFLGRALLARNEYPKAVLQLRKSNELLGEVPFSIGDLGYALAKAGERDEAARIREDLIERRAHPYYPAFPIAEIEVGLGRTDSALEWLDRAVGERHVGYYLPSVDPIYEPLRADPRFRTLLARLNVAY